MRRNRLAKDLAGLLIGGALLLLPGLGAVDLFNPDEPREAEIAREMRETGDGIVPTFNGCPFLEKPPLFYWCGWIVSRVPGLSEEAAARIPSVLAALGLLIVTYFLGRELRDRRTGRAAACLLLTTFQFWWLARRALLDMTLAFFVGASLLFFLLAVRGIAGSEAGSDEAVARPAASRGVASRRRHASVGWLLLAGVAAAAAGLTKGLIGLVIPGLTVLAFFLGINRWLLIVCLNVIAAAVPGGWLGLAIRGATGLGCLVFWRRRLRILVTPGFVAAAAVPVLALGGWVGLLAARPEGACYVREFLIENHLKRFFGGGYGGHAQPFWYYLESLLTDFQPWVLFLPAALVGLWPGFRMRERGRRSSERAETRMASGASDASQEVPKTPSGMERDGGADGFLHAWLVPALLFLSISSSKRSLYLLPIAPAAALLIATWWRSSARRLVRGRAGPALAIPAWILAALGALLAVALPVVIGALEMGAEPRSLAEALIAVKGFPLGLAAGAVLLASVATMVIIARRSLLRAAPAAIAIGGAIFLFAGSVLLPLAGPRLSARRFGEAIRVERARGSRIGAFRITEGSLAQFLFYSKGTLDWIGRKGDPESACCDCRLPVSAEEYLRGPKPRVCLLLKEDFEKLSPAARRGYVLERGKVGGATYVLLSAQDLMM